jgi:hypothetical protein
VSWSTIPSNCARIPSLATSLAITLDIGAIIIRYSLLLKARERSQIKSELDRLTPHEYNTAALEKLAELLKNVPQLWKEADQNQRNAIGRQLFKEVWVKDKQIVAVRPTEDFEPFFRVSFDDWNTVYTSNGSNPIGVACDTSWGRCLSYSAQSLTFYLDRFGGGQVITLRQFCLLSDFQEEY